ncbi:hypothetical protein AX760_25445 [Pararhizobium antarcticum]|uniref:Uncharacterized protein n=1 Tax=Pararhizobium antarcticum TaxID=1798805 RepID=A0A657LWZ2_9HYPH|nr:hypothetical protein AX760_25445 [Pararhizobium antarcticum]
MLLHLQERNGMIGDRADAMLEARHDGVYRRIEVITGGLHRRNWTDEEVKRKATCQDAADIAEALVNIRTYFMPKRAKQKF